ncbi:histidine phosphatase superfamily [Amanita rubescens]|nr:histidine phosphatase superfamily [Amanita rubescens]
METDWHGKSKRIHVVRHSEALNNIIYGYSERDPPLTAYGFSNAARMVLPFKPDLIISSPMSRAIQTAQTAFYNILRGPAAVPLMIWPDLREISDAIFNQGVSRFALLEKFPDLDFSLCMEEWDYEPHSYIAALERAERVKAALWKCDEKDIVIVSHQGFISYLVEGPLFSNCGK